ncbi:hypothetical protein [Caballeronia sordidicola]|uniref:hypothetical protein n=1 Tax=Caballeronia sordidicola TaxID=196367 RepID=UPI00117F5E29|nr:hypothetical protein [Caballeronia sordidicola]
MPIAMGRCRRTRQTLKARYNITLLGLSRIRCGGTLVIIRNLLKKYYGMPINHSDFERESKLKTSDKGNFMMQFLKILLAIIAIPFIASCASIVSGETEPINIQTAIGRARVVGASCSLTNSKGTWSVTTPGTVKILRAYGALNVDCQMPGVSDGTLRVKSSTKSLAFGNAIVGGIIGAGVDIGTSSAYDYPEKITVQMGMDGTAAYSAHFLPDGFFQTSEY